MIVIPVALKISLVTASIGLLLGFFGQRSRMCFIGGWRDFFLIRDTYLLKGFIAFLITAAVLFFVMDLRGEYMPKYPWFEELDEVSAEMAGDAHVWSDVCEFPHVSIANIVSVQGNSSIDFSLIWESAIMFIAAFGMGIFSTLANGCPLRQHVMAGSGNLSAWIYLLGFYFAIVIYNLWIFDFINGLLV